MENDIRKITTEEKETLNPRMLKCVNCGVPAELYVNNKRVCSDTVCVNVYSVVEWNNHLPSLIRDAEWSLSRVRKEYGELPRRPVYDFYRNKWDEHEKRLATRVANAERWLNELFEEQTKRYQEYLQEE